MYMYIERERDVPFSTFGFTSNGLNAKMYVFCDLGLKNICVPGQIYVFLNLEFKNVCIGYKRNVS